MNGKKYQHSNQNEIISCSFGNTALGLLLMAATDKGVCFAQFGETREQLWEQLSREIPDVKPVPCSAAGIHPLKSWTGAFGDYLKDTSSRPDIPLDLRGTDFQIRVWQFLFHLEAGTTMSYSQLASCMGKPGAARAVASACGANKIAVLIPCHRILRSDGSPGGYRWGLQRKKALLDREAA